MVYVGADCVVLVCVSAPLQRPAERATHSVHSWVAAIEYGAITQHTLLHWIDNRRLSWSVVFKGDARGEEEERVEEGGEGRKAAINTKE